MKKADLLEKAKELDLKVTEKDTVTEIKKAIDAYASGNDQKPAKKSGKTAEAITQTETTTDPETEDFAKSGKRSKKGVVEAKTKQKKIEKQHSEETKEPKTKKKVSVKPARSRLERRAKGYKKSAELIEKDKSYGLHEGLEVALKTSYVKFDATVELHIRLNVDPKQADQNIRDSVVLPAGTGKPLKVAVFTDPEGQKKAKQAGADISKGDEFLQQLDKGVIDFDVLITTPQMMPKLGKYARVLGPKGLMPNPKSGTVTADLEKAVKEAKAGKVEYRVDSAGIVHTAIGKISFGVEKLEQNAVAILSSIKSNKPGSIKGNYVRSIYLTTSMGPSIRLQESIV